MLQNFKFHLKNAYLKIKRNLLVRRLYKKDLAPNLPIFISIELEETCCLRCKHCNIWKNKASKKALNFQQMKIIIDKLKTWAKTKINITFSGGEPFLNKDATRVINYAHKSGFLTSTNSNGFLLNEEMVKKIIASGLNYLAISLDSHKAKVHNHIRGNMLAYKKAVQTIRLLAKHRGFNRQFKVAINTIIFQQNINDLVEIVKLGKRLGIDSHTFQPIYENFGIKPHDKNWYKNSSFWPKNKNEVKENINKLIKMKKRGYVIGNSVRQLKNFKLYFLNYKLYSSQNPCYAGVNNFAINKIGDVRLCYNFQPIGNICKESPAAIWNSLEAKKIRKRCRICKRGCRVLLCNTMPASFEIIQEKIRSFVINYGL